VSSDQKWLQLAVIMAIVLWHLWTVSCGQLVAPFAAGQTRFIWPSPRPPAISINS